MGVKKNEVAALRLREAELRQRAVALPAGTSGVPSFQEALLRGPGVAVIAEVKRKSPSAGVILKSADPVTMAAAYRRGGAAAISVLTDADFFDGSITDLEAVVAAVDAPVLRKDFTIDELQIIEARCAGASAVLLIVRLLDVASLRRLREVAESLGMAALVEAHDEAELDVALESGAVVIGINNRNLDTLAVDLAVSESLLPRIPRTCVAVGESGIRDAADVARLAAAGADAVLVGEALMRDGSPESGAALLSSVPRAAKRS